MAGSTSLLWAIAGLAGVISVGPRLDNRPAPPAMATSVSQVALARARDGQFYLDAQVDAVAIRFLVDPDADAVVIAGTDAAQIAPAQHVRITAGQIFADVPVRVSPDLPVSVLGRPFLDRVGGARVRGDRLILR